MLTLKTSWIAALAMTACSAGATADGRSAPPPLVIPTAPVAGDPATATNTSLQVAESACINGAPGPHCNDLLGPEETKALSGGIDRMQQIVRDTSFSDVHALVEVARLQLRRDKDVADTDGATDAARGLKNAMRAVAVDETVLQARLVLALALARSMQGARALGEPSTRDLALGLVDIALRSVPAAAGTAGAATKTLEGYIGLERGNRALARGAFEAATKLDPGLATAWVGLGDVARSEEAFEAAKAAYEKAAALLPADAGARRALEATTRRQVLALPAAPGPTRLSMASGPLAPPPPAAPRCPPSSPAPAKGASLCKGLADLAQATSRADQEQAAKLILDGWNDLRPLCEARDPACGPHVAQAVAAASRAFHAAGRVAKSIASAKILLSRPDLPGTDAVAPAITLEVADRYFALGVFDMAADYYTQHVRMKGANVGPAAERALSLRIALTNVDAATKLADELAIDAHHAATQRSNWLLSAAALVRAVRGPEAAGAWLRQHDALLDQAGMTLAMADLSKPLPQAATSTGSCAALLACAVRRLAGEARWSPRAQPLNP